MDTIYGLLILAAAQFALHAGVAAAEQTASNASDTVLVYRDTSGQLPIDSQQAAKKLKKAAKNYGFVELWLSVDSTVVFGTSDVSDDQYHQACARLLQPLVNREQVWHPTKGPTSNGSVCFVRASADGVAQLVRDKRFHQIMGTTHAH